MLVAKLTHDHLDNRKGGVEFTYNALVRFWNDQSIFVVGSTIQVDEMPRTEFRLYDDDGELYYSGWLKDDDEAMVQQFVLAWAMADSGCTILKVKTDEGWKQVIG